MHRRFDQTNAYCIYRGRDEYKPSESAESTADERRVPLTLGIASVPVQLWTGNVFEDEQGIACGTIFPDLVLPFTGGRVL